jgi:hypothetical protein
MKTKTLLLALAAGFVAHPCKIKAAEVLTNINSSGQYSTKGSAAACNIWFRTTTPQTNLFDQVILFGESGQTITQSFNFYQGIVGQGGGNMLTNPVVIQGVETELTGYSSYAFSLPESLKNLNLATYYAIELRDNSSTGSGLFSSNDNSTSSTISYNPVIAGGNDFGVQYQGVNLQFKLVSSPIPEPSAMALLGLGAMGLFARRRRN